MRSDKLPRFYDLLAEISVDSDIGGTIDAPDLASTSLRMIIAINDPPVRARAPSRDAGRPARLPLPGHGRDVRSLA